MIMKHLPLAHNGPYVISAKTKMTACPFDEGNCISPEHEEGNTKTCGSDSSSDHKKTPAASLNSKRTNNVADRDTAQRKEEDIRAPGTSERPAVRNKIHEARFSKEEVTSSPKTGTKEQQDTSDMLTAKNGT